MLRKLVIFVVLIVSLLAIVLLQFVSDVNTRRRKTDLEIFRNKPHLARLLCDNEDNDAVEKVNRDVFLLPNDTEIDKMDEAGATLVYWKYINSLQVLCRNQMRLGVMEDGGKEICFDEKYKPGYPCLAYSFGSNFQFDFELSLIQHFNCEIHTFDPTNPLRGRQIPKGINFHLIGMSGRNVTNAEGWRMQTLSSIRKLLNHSDIMLDILKIDIEGVEWTALPEIFQSGVLKYVKQLCIEIHFVEEAPLIHNISLNSQLKVLRDLYKHGFGIFMHERNLGTVRTLRPPYERMTIVNEISLINLRL